MNKLKNIGVFLFLVIFFLLSAELLTRVYFSFYDSLDTEMWKYSMKIKQKSGNPKIVFTHKPNTEAKLYGVNIKINSRGLRSEEYDYVKKKDAVRIVLIGDCMTLGWGVDYENIFSRRLEKKLEAIFPGKKFEFINLGIGNYNLIQESEFFLTEGSKYDADFYIVNYFLNDVEPTPVTKTNFILENSMFAVLIWSRFDNITREFDAKKNYVDYYKSLYDRNSKAYIQAWDAFDKMYRSMKGRNSKIYINILPIINNLKKNEYSFYNVHQQVNEELKKYDVTVIDLLPNFIDKNPDELWVSPLDTHYNKNAFKIMVDADIDEFKKSMSIK